MGEITVIQIGAATLAIVIGVIAGWIIRGRRCADEKIAVNESWQEQIEAQRSEHRRLVDQNKRLMEQVSQLQASGKDATNRAKELSDALKEAFSRRDDLQREIKEIRGSLQAALSERERLQADSRSAADMDTVIRQRDDKIFALSRELENWQNRLPPLMEKFRERNEEAARLTEELQAAERRIGELEKAALEAAGETMVESVEAEPTDEALQASNDPVEAHIPDDDTATAEVGAGDDDGYVTGEYAFDSEDVVLATGDADDDEDTSAVETVDDADIDVEFDVADDDERDEPVLADDAVTNINDYRDDLKLIKGVGPAIEKTLNELGIFRFSQIAEMSEYDIDRVAQRLKGFRSRIYREDWIGQARELDEHQAGESA